MLFSPDHIIPKLIATERLGAIQEMIAHLVQKGRIQPQNETRVVKLVNEGQPLYEPARIVAMETPTSAPNDAGCSLETIMVIGIVAPDVEWDGFKPPRIVLMLIHGPTYPAKDNRCAYRILRFLWKRTVREKLFSSSSAEEIWSILKPTYEGLARILDLNGTIVSTGDVMVNTEKGLARFYPDEPITGDRAAKLVTEVGEHHAVEACERTQSTSPICYELDLYKGSSVMRGVVLDENELPIKASVELLKSGRSPVWTDVEGRFTLKTFPLFADPAPDPAGFAKDSLRVRAAGFVAAEVEIKVTNDGPELHLRLQRGQIVKGRVTDPSGHLMEDVRVSLPGLPLCDCRTGRGGQFRIDSVPLGPVRLTLSKKGFRTESQEIANPHAEQTFILQPIGRILLTVVDDETKQPVHGFRVQLGLRAHVTGSYYWPHHLTADREAVINLHDPFLGFGPVQGKELVLKVESDGYVSTISPTIEMDLENDQIIELKMSRTSIR